MRRTSQIVRCLDRTRRVLALVFAAIILASSGAAPGAAAAGLAQGRDSDARRDGWQRPTDVLDALGAQPGARVADVGAGRGYFTFKLASRVGPEGHVYAVDVNQSVLDEIGARADRAGVSQVRAILGAPADPHLPDGLDAILVVDAYHEFREYDGMLAKMFRALRPGGRLVIIDGETSDGRERDAYHSLHRIPESVVRAEADRHGFRFVERREGFTNPDRRKEMYFLVFERPGHALP